MRSISIHKACAAIFFSILFCVFLNTLSYAKGSPEKAIQPLVLADYNNESMTTSTGGLTGGDGDMPGTLYASIVSDNGFRRGESGAAVKLDYEVSNPGDYTFYWMKLNRPMRGKADATESLDLTQYDYLSFLSSTSIKNLCRAGHS